ncbi:hypothetical protein [Nannocystis bainbridge]|uniref:Uncharacterized protein n=1 Tax=Nannocystis bainbridge TaxID=2995303 RepID=A0ABT5DYR9_9BACT|nr:hypothetical protein [Nannocystis bainbridge]MDC0718740.1 hypothetical protein [Nannocystis bainbridge]
MTKTFELNAYLGERRKLVDEAIVRALPDGGAGDPGRLKEGMRYAVLQGGKRMRPLVIIAACDRCVIASPPAAPRSACPP